MVGYPCAPAPDPRRLIAPMAEPPIHAPVLDLVMNGLVARALHAIVERGVPDLLADTPPGSADLVAKTGADRAPCTRCRGRSPAPGTCTPTARAGSR
jgi:hypothetical protein